MARRGSEEAYPLVHRTVSDESFSSFYDGHFSPVSAFGDYEPYTGSSSSQTYFTSSHTSTTDFQSRSPGDDLDISHLPLTPKANSSTSLYKPYSAAHVANTPIADSSTNRYKPYSTAQVPSTSTADSSKTFYKPYNASSVPPTPTADSTTSMYKPYNATTVPATPTAGAPVNSYKPYSAVSVLPTQTADISTHSYTPYNATPARAQDSLRSGPPPSPSAAYNSNRFSWNSTDTGGSASPIEKIADGARNFAGRVRSFRNPGMRRTGSHQPIPEGDEFDMGVMEAEYKAGATGRFFSEAGGAPDDEVTFDVDISSFGGPMSSEEVSALQQLESQGHLTGGLGAGLKVDATISSKDLLSSITASPVPATKRLSKLDHGLYRSSTLRNLGQQEANRRGQVIQVVVEEEEPAQQVDLSSFGAENTPEREFDPAGQLRRTAPIKSEIYFPRVNWKPISMRWPYLVALITVSITLAVAQEYLYQKSSSRLAQNLGLFTFQKPEDIATFDYFTFKYAPTMIAVTYGVLWQFTDFEVKRLEAYYQLSKEGGASADESINVDYVTVFNLWRPFRALRYKHWAVFVSSIATICAVSLVPTLQVASLFVLSQNEFKLVVIQATYSRVLTATLGFLAILGCILLWHLESRASGLVADVKGIAGIAAMATKSHVLMDFKNLDKYPPKAIHEKLKDRRYILRGSSLSASDDNKVFNTSEPDLDHEETVSNPHPLMLRPLISIPFIIAMMVFTVFLPIVLFVRAAHVVTIRAPWVLTLLAVFIKICFQTLEQDVRMLEPYYILSCRHAHPRVLTLDYTSMAFLLMPIRAFLNGHYLMALVGFGSVFAEILTVCVTSFAGVTGDDFLPPPGSPTSRRDSTGESEGTGDVTPLSFWISFSLSMGIMIYLVLLTSLTLYLRRHPFLPRQPSTIASVLAYIHQSKMLTDFVGYEQDNELMVRKLAERKLAFGLGWFRGRDGATHCGVDKEELIASYTHEKARDMRRAVVEGGENWEVF